MAEKNVFHDGQEIRLLLLNGTVSEEVYHVKTGSNGIATERAQIKVVQKGTDRELTVNPRRVLPIDARNSATVVELSGKYRAICPLCGKTSDIDDSECLKCVTCKKSFSLFWLGVKPMSETTQEKKKPVARAKKEEHVPVKVDVEALKELGELWTKKTAFNHDEVHVKSHVLVRKDKHGIRKLNFNSYNGTYGRKSTGLPLEAFKKDQPLTGDKKPWYAVESLENEHASLKKKGYHQE